MDRELIGLIRRSRSPWLRAILWVVFAILVAYGALHAFVFITTLFIPHSEARLVIGSWLSWFHWAGSLTPALVILFLFAVAGLSALEVLRALVTLGFIRNPAAEAQIEQLAPQSPSTPATSSIPDVALSPRPNAPAFIVGKVIRFAVVDAMDLSSDDFKNLEEEFRAAARRSRPTMWYVAWLQLHSLNAPTRAIDWHFEIQNKVGAIVEANPTSKRWRRPQSWAEIAYTTLDVIQHGVLNAGQIYNVLLYLSIDELASNLALDTFRASFTDGDGRSAVLVMDEARNAKRIFDEVPQASSLQVRIQLFAQAIRRALITYHGSTNSDEFIDNAIHSECTTRIAPLVNGLEAILGRTTTIDAIRNGDYQTVRGMATVADNLDIAVAQMNRR
jgi:hypothetical protein